MLGLFASGLLDIVQEHCELQNLVIDPVDGGTMARAFCMTRSMWSKRCATDCPRVTHAADDFTSSGICSLDMLLYFFMIAILPVDKHPVTLTRVAAGSGAKYVAGPLTWREKGNSGTVVSMGTDRGELLGSA